MLTGIQNLQQIWSGDNAVEQPPPPIVPTPIAPPPELPQAEFRALSVEQQIANAAWRASGFASFSDSDIAVWYAGLSNSERNDLPSYVYNRASNIYENYLMRNAGARVGSVGTLLTNVVNTATFGAWDRAAMPGSHAERFQAGRNVANARHNVSAAVGRYIGYYLQYKLGKAIVGVVTGRIPAVSDLPQGTQKIINTAIAGGGITIGHGVARGDSPSEIAINTAISVIGNVVGGAAGEIVGNIIPDVSMWSKPLQNVVSGTAQTMVVNILLDEGYSEEDVLELITKGLFDVLFD